MNFRMFQRCHVTRETVLQVTEGDNTEDHSPLQRMPYLMSYHLRDRGVNGRELTLLLKAFLFLQCHVGFLANKKDMNL